MDNMLIGNIVYRIERSTCLENPMLNKKKLENKDIIKQNCDGNRLNCTSILPINHWRKTLNCSRNCVPTKVIYKDNIAINGHKLCVGGTCYRERRSPNRKFISSYSTLNARKNEYREWTLKIGSWENSEQPVGAVVFQTPDIKGTFKGTLLESLTNGAVFIKVITESTMTFKKNNTLDIGGVKIDNILDATFVSHTINPPKKFTNPKFQTTGAVSGRNRIAKLKNDAISCPTTYWTKKNINEEKRCKPYHYGGKRKISLLICPPKDK
jgi:hypothetical protein